MEKTVLLTGATDGIGFETAKRVAADGHKLLLHGRNPSKLEGAAQTLSRAGFAGEIKSYCADLSKVTDLRGFADTLLSEHDSIDILINNAGVFKTTKTETDDGLDIRFMVNTIAPYYLTKRLLPVVPRDGRIINLSSAAQASVDIDAIGAAPTLSDNAAYAQSKLAITMWSIHLAQSLSRTGPSVIAVNPASLLASKMVKDAYGVSGKDLSIGADILVRASFSDEFADASGKYYDNDRPGFATPHPDAMDPGKNEFLVAKISSLLESIGLASN